MGELASDALRPLRVVVADDNEALRGLVEALLSLLPGVEVVATCGDGFAALDAARDEEADVVVLDVHMPGLGGVQAAELLTAYRPGSSAVLFTAQPDGGIREAAARLGVPVIDKLQADDLAAALAAEAGRVRDGDGGSAEPIERLVLLALAAHTDEAVLVVRGDWTIAYYNPAGAEHLGLPFPPVEGLDFSVLRERVATVHRDGTPRALETRPLSVAVAERRAVTDEVCELRDGRIVVFESRALPFFDGDAFLGAAAYWRPVDEVPLPDEPSRL